MWFSKLSCVLFCVLCLCSIACTKIPRVQKPEERAPFERILALSILSLREGSEEGMLHAKAGFELLTEIDATDPRGWDGLASLAIRIGRLKKAVEYLEYAMKCDSHYDYAIAHRGYVAELEQDKQQAHTWYVKALEENPLNVDARLGLARISGRKEALVELRKLALIKPEPITNISAN